jgi:hypothetical protein
MFRKGLLFLITGVGLALADVVLVKSGALVIGPCTGAGAILLMITGCITALIGLVVIGVVLGKNQRIAARNKSQIGA